MGILHWDVTEAANLTRFYNAEFQQLPYCYPVTPEEFELGFRYQEEKDEPYEMLSHEHLIVGEQGGELVGFVHVAVWHKGQEVDSRIGRHPVEEILEDRVGLILFFHYRSGHRQIGQALLEAAEQYLLDLGAHQIRAFSYYGYRFHRFNRAFLCDALLHVCGLFRLNGYRITRGSILLELPHFVVSPPVALDEAVVVRTEQKPGRGFLPNVEVKLFRGDQRIGHGLAVSAGHYCRALEAQRTLYIPHFSIEGSPMGSIVSEGEQGKGLGRYMMQALLWETRQVGYMDATLYVSMSNPRPQVFYANMGYQVVDTSYQWFKDLSQDLPLSLYKEVGF